MYSDNYLDRVDIVGNDNELSGLLLDQGGDGVDSVPDDGGSLGGGVTLAGGSGLSALTKALLLLLLRLGTVLVQQTEKLSGWKRKK